ncbi:UPF0481 protein [Musa troglodytarum]|uniref:UPF0481 protein n=1 Tax=Musa troglodytarum TaxID=320322 RepID=A0A9E7FDH3_9LILI|nr:UPF0481 protein [Musa troglodytarum]
MSSSEESIEEWLRWVKMRVAETKWEGRRTDGPTIFRVPEIFREADSKAYEPRMVSLGPYHHRDKFDPKAMEDLKLHYLKKFLGRNPGKSLEDYIKQIKEKEPQARMAYSEEVRMSSDAFSQMMLLDCCFVIEIIHSWKTYVERQEKQEAEEVEAVDKQIRCPWYWFRTARSMARQMSEKQLNTDEKETEATLFDSAYPDRPNLLKEQALEFVGGTFMNREMKLTSDIGEIYHLLHVMHFVISPPEKKRDAGEPFVFCWPLQPMKKSCLLSEDDLEGTDHSTSLLKWIPSATQLMEAGVRFRKKEEATNFLDITFQNGEMEIPLLQIDDDTNILFRNLIAFEQCSKDVSPHVAAYATLMDCIINTAADVALLQQHGIILSGLGDGNQVANLFNKLCKEVTLDYGNAYVSDIYKDVNEHCDTKYNRWRARLNHDYFSNPWAIISVFAAILLFVLAITQTIFSVLSYVRPPN